MKQYFELGFCVASLAGVAAVLLQDWTLLYRFSGVIGITAVVFASLVLATINHKRSYTGTPVRAAQEKRKQYAAALFVFSIPNLMAAALSLLLK
ncbi:DUF5316 family protein [Ectobacillus panaciterrae]|uniref:DUF5316 family protein n=1 Tax=Ectobacillus panaciterrae TaxID=363872 RepID=UPI0004047447|nr:DUF5316 family protein [Ectobacillus panaciterrae]